MVGDGFPSGKALRWCYGRGQLEKGDWNPGLLTMRLSQWSISPTVWAAGKPRRAWGHGESLWRSYNMIPGAIVWFWVCKVGKQRCPGCTFVHKHTSFVKTPRFIQTCRRSDVQKGFLSAKFGNNPLLQLSSTPSLGREWGIWNQNWKYAIPDNYLFKALAKIIRHSQSMPGWNKWGFIPVGLFLSRTKGKAGQLHLVELSCLVS